MGLGEGPINKVGPMSQPRGSTGTASRTLIHTHAHVHIFTVVGSENADVREGSTSWTKDWRGPMDDTDILLILFCLLYTSDAADE